jgi:rhodanese-related sulfurtransferase
MDPRTVHDRREDLQVLDVRENDEWVAGRIDGARHLPLGQLAARVGELDPNRTVVTVCRSGGRAGRAADLLASCGLSAQVLDGGMQQWERDHLPITTPDGRPGSVA